MSKIGELNSSVADEIRGHSLMTSAGKGRFTGFSPILRMFVNRIGEGSLTLLDVHLYMKQIFLTMISEDILNVFAFQLV